ncbi:hypothetical protein Vadar_034256 [Vaccinium darrowii]|uniref:Uncharacterized protein n=1 Tax=Vaccinium darrowii TaxID=229202 RepID=A0ACB7Z816_9ERIC|nr:hypothetical protein Vadar_034256 [Vaccinium darrowii]
MEYYSDEHEVVPDMPVSPTGQYFNSSVLQVSVLGVLESEIPLDDLPAMALLKDVFLPINPRFSYTMTINDVIAGVIFLGTRLYMQQSSTTNDVDHQQQGNPNADATALVVLNTRALGEMVKPNSPMSWGNHFTFLHVSIPKLTRNNQVDSNPLRFVKEAHWTIKRKRNSAAVYLTGWMLEILRKFRGPEAVAWYICNTITNSSIAMSNLIGPVEQMALANHPIKGLYFTIVGGPQILTITIISYVDKLRITIRMEKGFMDPQKFNCCIENAFEMIFTAAVQNSPPSK